MDGLYILIANHYGASNFAVWLIDADDGTNVDLLFNEIGDLTVKPTRFRAPSGRYRMAVTADGSWDLILSALNTP